MYQNRQAYAPTPHSYIPNTTLSATINLDEVSFSAFSRDTANDPQEVKLAETRAERDLQDSLAEVFSIIITLDELEKAYLKDAISESDYTEICDRLLKQYKAILTDEAVAREFGDLESFKREWEVRSISIRQVQKLKSKDGSSSSYRTDSNWPAKHSDSTDTQCRYDL
jgi:ESCRT-I complex subunit VPS28